MSTYEQRGGRASSAHEPFLGMLRTVNQSPMTAAELLVGLARVLHAPAQGRSVADPASPRGCALRALAYMATANTMGVRAELSTIGTGIERYDRRVAASLRPGDDNLSPVHAGPHIAYDDETGLVWGYGETLPHTLADAGWHVKEAGGAREMVSMRYVPCVSSFGERLETCGPGLPWLIRADGIAAPETGP